MVDSMLIIGLLIAFLVGLNKVGLKGVSIISVALMAMIFPAKQSIGVLLPLLLVADIIAVWYYRRHAKLKLLLILIPSVIIGMIIGAFILGSITSEVLKPLLGWLLLGLLGVEIIRKKFDYKGITKNKWVVHSFGALAGIVTTLGNVAGPIASIYLLSHSLPKKEFIGTGAWFFLIVNAIKFPLFFGMGLITLETLLFDLTILPLIAVGALVGIYIIKKIPEKGYLYLVYLTIVIASLKLII